MVEEERGLGVSSESKATPDQVSTLTRGRSYTLGQRWLPAWGRRNHIPLETVATRASDAKSNCVTMAAHTRHTVITVLYHPGQCYVPWLHTGVRHKGPGRACHLPLKGPCQLLAEFHKGRADPVVRCRGSQHATFPLVWMGRNARNRWTSR